MLDASEHDYGSELTVLLDYNLAGAFVSLKREPRFAVARVAALCVTTSLLARITHHALDDSCGMTINKISSRMGSSIQIDVCSFSYFSLSMLQYNLLIGIIIYFYFASNIIILSRLEFALIGNTSLKY